MVWNYSYVTDMAPGQKRHTSQARFSYAAEPRARVKYSLFYQSYRRACAR